MKILLTGYKGFIGQNILKTVEQEHQCFLIEKDSVEEYLNNIHTLEIVVEMCDVILHNGAISDTSNENYKEVMFYNVYFTKKLIEISKKYNKKIIFASSASIYGNSNYPQNLYAWSKMISEDYGRAFYPEGFTALRYFNVYGPYEEHKGNMSSVAYQAWKHLVKMNNNDLFSLFPKKPKRDFVYVKDVVSANLKAIESPSGVYDVGSGDARTFEDVLNLIDIPYTYTSEDIIPHWYQFFTQSDKDKWLPNWNPKYNLEGGCKDYLKYLNEK
jgi:ADP-L-glycero-D-manno-heptose 6-epimerase